MSINNIVKYVKGSRQEVSWLRSGQDDEIRREDGASEYFWEAGLRLFSQTGAAVIPSNGVCLCTRSN